MLKRQLLTAMQQGAIVITPNNRLSNQLLQDYALENQTNVMAKPLCLPYPAFLRHAFKKIQQALPHNTHPIVLSTQQHQYLWHQVLMNHHNPSHEGLITAVLEAWTRCQHWQLDMEHAAFKLTPQTQQFQRWQADFKHQLDALHAITEEQLADYLIVHFKSLQLKEIIWACFDDYTPQQRALQQAIHNQGGKSSHYDLPSQPCQAYHYPAKDGQDETLQMIHWLQSKLKANESRIAVVVPNLQTQHRALQRVLEQHISTEQFNLSLGSSLHSYPLVAHALQWLSLEPTHLSNHQARLLLHSPYLAHSKNEFHARSQVMQESHALREMTLSLPAWIQTLTSSAPKLGECLKKIQEPPEKASPATWITFFKTRLAQLGFPGEYPLNSTNYQCFQRIMSLFDELLQLALIQPVMSHHEALWAFTYLTKNTIFQPQKTTTPIQILGLLEASGCTFESIWMMGLTDQCLPQKTNFSAFIPLSLQRTLQMPHADPVRELKLAQQILQRLQHGCHHAVFSYPQLTGDTPNLPSPLIRSLPIWEAYQPDVKHSLTSLVCRDETYHLPLLPQEAATGGTALLANQAKCPFRAFAAHRLHAQKHFSPSNGPDPMERGQIIHHILDSLWRRLRSQQALLNTAPDQLKTYIKTAIHAALEPIKQARPYSFPTLIQEVESARLTTLINASLDWERQRSPFLVDAVEQSFTFRLAQLDFRIRVDRLDHVLPDNKWVIDYKSRLPTNKPWNEERPEEPQLLLYALLDKHINALLFLQLKAGNVICSGLSETDVSIKGMQSLKKEEQWSLRQEQWLEQLTQLAHEFKTGHCSVQPYRHSTCQRCDFPDLCRIDRTNTLKT